MTDLKGKTALVLGAGKSGISTAKFLLTRQLNKIILSDSKPRAKFDEQALALEKQGVVLETDGHKDSSFMEADIIIVSPGVPVQAKWRETAARHNKILAGDVEFAYQFFKEARVIAITGTNGKTTTTTLIYDILKDQLGDRVELAGNIGIPFCDLLTQNKKPEYIVIEISSFQLETIRDFKPLVSIILNVTDDHLDRYATMQEYAMAKANVFKNQDENGLLILNAEDKFTSIMTSMAKCKKEYFSAYKQVDGCYYADGMFREKQGPSVRDIFAVSEMKLIGRHNYENVLSAWMTARFIGLDMQKAEKVIKNFEGLHHRIEFIGEARGIKCYDDSKGTNTDAVLKAMDAFKDDMALILGGREKGTDFTPILNALTPNIRAIIALGENRDKLEQIFSPKIKVHKAASMEEAVNKGLAVEGIKVLLLSPACASFDLFRNYAHRGDEFKKYVLKAAGK